MNRYFRYSDGFINIEAIAHVMVAGDEGKADVYFIGGQKATVEGIEAERLIRELRAKATDLRAQPSN